MFSTNEVAYLVELAAVGGQSVLSSGTSGVGGAVLTDANLLVTQSDFWRNSSRGDTGGGAIHFTALSTSTVANSTFTENLSNNAVNGMRRPGGAIAALNAEVEVINSTFYKSEAEDEVFSTDLAEIFLVNNIIHGRENTCIEGDITYPGQIWDLGGNFQFTEENQKNGRCGEPNNPPQPGYTVPDLDTELVAGTHTVKDTKLPNGGSLLMLYYQPFSMKAQLSDPSQTNFCDLPPINSVDMLGKDRSYVTCTSGAIETPNIGIYPDAIN